jgi:hypothetical protein
MAVGAIAATPSMALAQESGAEFFVGASAGYHDLGVDTEDPDFEGFEVDDASPIIGGFVGVDFPVGANLFAGVEGNYHFGTDVIDSEYGVSGRFGFVGEGGSKYYVRGGYQEIDLDISGIFNEDLSEFEDEFDTSDGDYLVGLGADFPIGAVKLRFNLDTISFDTVRGTAGVAFSF